MSMPNNDQCPQCNKNGLPALPDNSVATARRCQECGRTIERLDPDVEEKKP